MSDMQTLFRMVDELGPDELKQLCDYLEQSHARFSELQSTAPSDAPRILGLHAHLGTAWMSDDFDEPLSDEFWLGEA